MSIVLFKEEWKKNRLILLIFMLVLTLYGSIVIAMYDPKLGESLKLMAEAMPQLFAAFNMKDPGLTLLDFLCNYLYGFIFIVIPLIFTLLMCHRLFARYLDRGFMAYLLASPHSRASILLTQISVLVSFLVLLMGYAVVLIVICSTLMFSESLDIIGLLAIQGGLLCLHVMLGGIGMLLVVCFNSMKISCSVMILFLLIQMLAQVNERLDMLNMLTPLSLFDAKGLQHFENGAGWKCFAMIVIFLVCVGGALQIFKRKDLML